MHLNFLQPPATSWTLGDLDITPIVAEFAVRQPIAEIATPLIWSGDMTLAQRLGPPFPESLHELENPLRWERGQHPLVVRFWGAKFCTLRIAEYFYDEDTFTARAALTDILGLLDFRSPPAECEGIVVGSQNKWQNIIKILLLQGSEIDGLPYLQEDNILFDSNLPDGFYESPIIKTGSYIKTAQEIAGGHGCFLWVDADENVRISRYPVNTPAPINVLSRAQVDLYQRQPAPEGPFDKVIVTGTKECVANCPKGDPPVLETYGVLDGQKIVTGRETRTTKESGTSKLVVSVKKEQALGDMFPDEHKGKISLVVSEQSEETHFYDAEGRTKKIVTRKDLPRGIALPDIPKYQGSDTLLTDAEKVEEEFFYGNASDGTREAAGGQGTPATDDGVCHRKVLTTWGRFPITVDASMDIFDDAGYSGLIIREEVEERWQGGENVQPDAEKPPCLRWRYTRTTKRRGTTESTLNIVRDGETQTTTRKGPGALATVQLESSEDSTPSGGPTREPDAPMGTVALKGEASLTPANYQTFAPRQSEVNVSWLTSNANAQRLAELLAKLQWQRRFSRFISHPVYEWFALGWRPFIRLDVHKGSWIVDGLAIACAGGEAEFSWIGNLLGEIPEIPIPPEPPTWQPQPEKDINGQPVLVNGQYVYPLQVGPLPPLNLIAGVPIVPVPVRVVGGSGNHGFLLSGLPDGLSVVNGYLTGTPTTTGAFNGQISVNDGGNTVTTPATGNATPIPSPAALVSLTMPLSQRRVRSSAFRVEDAFLTPDMVFNGPRERISSFELDTTTVRQVRTREAGFTLAEGLAIDAVRERMANFYIGDISMVATRTRSAPVESSPISVRQVRVRMAQTRDASTELTHVSSNNPSGIPAVEGMTWTANRLGPPPRIIDWVGSGGVWTGTTRGGGIDGSAYGEPLGLTAPDYIGQQYFDGVTTWVATGETNQDWSALTK